MDAVTSNGLLQAAAFALLFFLGILPLYLNRERRRSATDKSGAGEGTAVVIAADGCNGDSGAGGDAGCSGGGGGE